MTIEEKQEKYIELFKTLGDEFDIYTYIMKIAMQESKMDDADKIEENRFLGCQSNLWIKINIKGNKMTLLVDSDTLIVKGIAMILADMFNGETLESIAEVRIYLWEALNLEIALTSIRRNGFNELTNYIQNIARGQ